MNDKSATILALGSHKKQPTNLMSDDKSSDSTSPTLEKNITAQSADGHFQNGAGRHGQAVTKLTLNEQGVLARRLSIDRAVQKLAVQLFQLHFLSLPHHSLIFCQLDSVVSMTQCKGLVIIWTELAICIEQKATATAMLNCGSTLTQSASYNISMLWVLQNLSQRIFWDR